MKTIVTVRKDNFIWHLTENDLKEILADLHDESMYSKADLKDISDWVEWYFEEMDDESIADVLGRFWDEQIPAVAVSWEGKDSAEMLNKLWDYPDEEEE